MTVAAKKGLTEFARHVIREMCFEGSQYDGDDIQDLAVEHGLLIETTYSRAKHGPNEVDAEDGDRWFVFSPLLGGKP